MEIYKIITLLLILNIGVSMGAEFSKPTATWESWASSSAGADIWEFMRDNTEDGLDRDNVQVQQNVDQLENTGGYSMGTVIGILYGLTETVLIGGIRESIGLAIGGLDEGETIIAIVAWMSVLFFVFMYAYLGIKLMNILKNRDTA